MGSRGIRVNLIAPGYIETDMTKELSEETRNRIILDTSLRRIGTPEDIASAVWFLVNSSYITGQVISVDGGLRL